MEGNPRCFLHRRVCIWTVLVKAPSKLTTRVSQLLLSRKNSGLNDSSIACKVMCFFHIFDRSCNSLSCKQKKLSVSFCESPPYAIVVHRNGVRQCLLQLYQQKECHHLNSSLSVEFVCERAEDLFGLTRELFSIFFQKVKDAYFEGCMQMAPRVDLQTRDSDGTLFTTLGRIASHCFVVTGVFSNLCISSISTFCSLAIRANSRINFDFFLFELH